MDLAGGLLDMDDDTLLEVVGAWLAATEDIDAAMASCRRLGGLGSRCVSHARQDRLSCSAHGIFENRLNPAFSLRHWRCLTSLFGVAVATADTCRFSCAVETELRRGAYRVAWRLKSTSDSTAQFRLLVLSPDLGLPVATAVYTPKEYAHAGWRYVVVGVVSVTSARGIVRTVFEKHCGVRTSVWKQAAVALDCVLFQPC